MTPEAAVASPVITSLASYSCLGHSGLRVAPLCLGTMTFGTEWGWGSPVEAARQMPSYEKLVARLPARLEALLKEARRRLIDPRRV